MLQDKNCKFLITKPTRFGITRARSDKPGIRSETLNLLDHIYTNDSDLVHVTSGTVETYDISDHYPIYCQVDNTNLTAIEKKENSRSNFKLRMMLRQSVNSLKTMCIHRHKSVIR